MIIVRAPHIPLTGYALGRPALPADLWGCRKPSRNYRQTAQRFCALQVFQY